MCFEAAKFLVDMSNVLYIGATEPSEAGAAITALGNALTHTMELLLSAFSCDHHTIVKTSSCHHLKCGLWKPTQLFHRFETPSRSIGSLEVDDHSPGRSHAAVENEQSFSRPSSACFTFAPKVFKECDCLPPVGWFQDLFYCLCALHQ